MKTILRYAGGKTRAIKKITPFVEDYQTIVSPFIGGGSLEVHWAHKGHEVIGADIFDILVTFWQQLLANPQGVADTMRKINPTAEEYKKVKEELMCTPEVQQMLAGWKTDFYHRDPAALLRLGVKTLPERQVVEQDDHERGEFQVPLLTSGASGL